MIKVDKYFNTDFSKSVACYKLAGNLQHEVKIFMVRLTKTGNFGAITARIISPFLGTGTLLISLILRVGSVVEPIFGMFVDLGAALVCLSTLPLLNFLQRFVHIFRNLRGNGKKIPVDLFKVGLVATFGGIISPKAAYDKLSDRCDERINKPLFGSKRMVEVK